MRKFRNIASLLVLLSMVLLLTTGVTPASQDLAKYTPEVKTFTYPNGLTLLVVERHDAPTIACLRYHKVGSVNEYPGVTGAAHLLEHMMFKGTRKIGTWNYESEKPIMEEIDRLMDEIEKEQAKDLSTHNPPDREKMKRLWDRVKELQNQQRKYIRKDELNNLYNTQGSNGLNAFTSFDETAYIVDIPSNKLEMWAFMEADRISDPVFREFYSERDVVHEERRMRMNSPSGQMIESTLSTLFTTMPYRHDIVGVPSDLNTMRRKQMEEFFTKYYAPNNTVLVLIGNVKAEKADQLVKKYFGSIPRQPEPRPVFSQDPPRKGERRTKVIYPAEPQIQIAFKGPKQGHPDQYALEVLALILSSGRTSRFYENLVKKEIAFNARAGQWNLAYGNIFLMNATPRNNVTTEELEQAIYREVDRLKTEPVAAWELEKVRNNYQKGFISFLKENMQLAIELARAQAWTGDWDKFDDREKIMAVTPEDIMRVANTYLNEDDRAVITLVTEKKEEAKK